MSRSMSEAWRRAVAARWARPQRLVISPGGEEFTAWCQAHPGSAVELGVSARALHELLVEPGLPLADLEAVHAYAQQQFAHYFGAAAQRFAIAPWRLGDACGASALQGLDVTALQAQARAAGVRIVALRPAWAMWLAALPASLRAATGRLVWHEAGVAVVLGLERGRLVALQARRVASLDDLPGEAPLAVGSPASDLRPQPGPDVPRPDFLPRPVRSPLAWPLAATGALVLATAGWTAFDSHQARAEAQAARDRLTPLRPAGATAGRRMAAAVPASDGRAASEARALLAMPWEPLLSRVEAVGAEAGSVAWLGLDAHAARGELKLDGLAPARQPALQVTDQLARSPGWRQVVLSRFSAPEAGQVGQRFEISARVPTGGQP